MDVQRFLRIYINIIAPIVHYYKALKNSKLDNY